MLNNDMVLSLKSDTFAALKEDFDGILSKTIGNMEMRGAEEATITLKLGISLEKSSISGPAGIQNITKPSFKHDISSVMQVKDKKSGALTGDYALIWDETEGKWVARRIDNGQITLFDTEGVVADAEYSEVSDSPAITDGEPHLLPAPSLGEDAGNDERETGDTNESQDGSSGAYDPDTPFGWMHGFVGQELRVTEAMGNYTVRSMDNKIVLSSATDPRSPFYCSEEKLKKHVGHTLTCIGSPSDEELFDVISIWCEDCDEELFEIGRSTDDEYKYDEPEDDDPEDSDPGDGE